MNKFKLRSGNKTSFKEMGSSNSIYKNPVGPVATEKKMTKKDWDKREKENWIEHNVEAKMDEYPPKHFHHDIKKKNKKASPAKGLRDEQVIDGQRCDAYGNPKPTQQEMQNMTKCPDFSNKAQKGKQERGLGPAFDKKEKKEMVKQEAKEKSGKEVDKEAKKALKKEKDMKTMDEAIDATLGK